MGHLPAPCGTEAAYRRHQRHGERPCFECTQAMTRAKADRQGTNAGTQTPDPRERRNGLPAFRPYVWRGAA